MSWKCFEKTVLQSRFSELSNEEIERLLKNSIPVKTKKATSLGMVRNSRFLRNVYLKISLKKMFDVWTGPKLQTQMKILYNPPQTGSSRSSYKIIQKCNIKIYNGTVIIKILVSTRRENHVTTGVTDLLQSATAITKCDDYYKARKYNIPVVWSNKSTQSILSI